MVKYIIISKEKKILKRLFTCPAFFYFNKWDEVKKFIDENNDKYILKIECIGDILR